jgi:hypothetical protein
MIANTAERDFEVIEITNEMPYNRIGGVGSVIESLMSGFAKLDVHALWYVADHQYPEHEVAAILARYPRVVLGNHAELAAFRAPVAHVHSYNHPPGLLDALDGARSLFTIHSLLAYEEVSNDVNLRGAVAAQEHLIGACDEVVLVSEAELAAPIERWIRSLGVDLEAGRSELQQQALKAHRRLLNIKCAQFVRDDAQRTKEEQDEFWYLGEEIETYANCC